MTACRFRVMRDDDVHGWLGASPDGLVPGLLTTSGELLPCTLPMAVSNGLSCSHVHGR